MAREVDILDEYGAEIGAALGFNTTSNSTKPLSIANALFRSCLRTICDTKDIHEWIVSERRNSDRILKSSEIRDKYQHILVRGANESIDDIKEARFVLEQVFNPDSTVYPSYQDSVMNIPSRWLVRPSFKAEARIGDFIYEILSCPINGKASPAIELIKAALKDDDDDISRLIKPILTSAYKDKERILDVEINIQSISLNSSKQAIRKGFDNLTANMHYTGQARNSLLVLKRMVNYAAFASYYYLVDVNNAEYKGDRIPLLLDSFSDLDAIERASELCYIACKKSVEAYAVNLLEDIIRRERLVADITSVDACRAFIKGMPLKSAKERKNARDALLQYFETFYAGGDEPLRALSRALQFAIYTFTYPNNTPSDFCRVLGTRAGLVGPGGGAKFKRLLIHRFLLETIVLSTVNLKGMPDGIELRELGELLRSQYYILIGTDTDKDYSLLDQAKIAQDAPEDLRGELASNARSIADMLITMGLAKRYADGVTIIGWGL
ncbi:hypothetical protein [Desulfotomaculum sp. 1211_IL3151]|uniref:hypothetical protein n=1 Tax=Desulfotomaculum sp. 1211_IL3151 TaxID=3084055 RepID=UPI002FD908AC